MFFQTNYLERETDNLGEIDIRSEILSLHQISHCIASYEYENALELMKIHQRDLGLNDEGIYYEFQLMEIFCLFQLKEFEKTREKALEIYRDLQKQQNNILERSNHSQNQQSLSKTTLYQGLFRSFSVRFYTFVISVCTRGININIDPASVLDRLIRILRVDNCIYLAEVLGTLTGCKNFKQVKALKVLKGQDSKRKAMKLEVLANWKYLVNEKSECIKFKKEALIVWRQENCLQQKEKCEKELKQLIENQTSSKKKGTFILKLDNLSFFTKKLIKLEDQVQQKPPQLRIKWSFPALISSLQSTEDSKKPQKSSLSQSKFQKISERSTQLSSIIHKAEQFFQSYKKESNDEVTSLIHNSKFIDQRTKQIRKKLLILSQIKRYAFRLCFPFIVECAIERSKQLNKKKSISQR